LRCYQGRHIQFDNTRRILNHLCRNHLLPTDTQLLRYHIAVCILRYCRRSTLVLFCTQRAGKASRYLRAQFQYSGRRMDRTLLLLYVRKLLLF